MQPLLFNSILDSIEKKVLDAGEEVFRIHASLYHRGEGKKEAICHDYLVQLIVSGDVEGMIFLGTESGSNRGLLQQLKKHRNIMSELDEIASYPLESLSHEFAQRFRTELARWDVNVELAVKAENGKTFSIDYTKGITQQSEIVFTEDDNFSAEIFLTSFLPYNQKNS